MDAEAILSKLQATGAFLLLVDGQLAVKEDSLTGATESVLTMLTANREALKLLLLDREQHDVKPYIDELCNMGHSEKGCLVIPSDCAPRYKNWRPGFSCILVESDDWYKTGKSLKESDKLKWKPLKLAAILNEVGASEELMKRYCPKS